MRFKGPENLPAEFDELLTATGHEAIEEGEYGGNNP